MLPMLHNYWKYLHNSHIKSTFHLNWKETLGFGDLFI
jgi:hypothetical protein